MGRRFALGAAWIVAGVALALAPVQAGKVLDRVMASKVMVMSTDPAYPPQSSLDAKKEFVGFDIDVGSEIARRMGVEVRFVAPGWEAVTAGDWDGRWDISVGSMTPTKTRSKVLDFPAIYYYTPAALAVHVDNTTITTPAKASGKRIGVVASTTYESYLNHQLVIDAVDFPTFAYEIEKPQIRTYADDVAALEELARGDGVKLDAIMTALPSILDAMRKGSPLKIIGAPLFLEPLAVAIDKGDPEWGARIRAVVDAMHADGTLSRLSEKWYGADLTQ